MTKNGDGRAPLVTSSSRLLELGIVEWVNSDDTTLLEPPPASQRIPVEFFAGRSS